MDWLRNLNKAIDYIEDNLTKDINYDKAAKIACCSTYHFQRMFSYISEVSLAEYIRRRRMTLAAFDLQNSEDKIIDIALKYTYESPTSFNRAFKNIHNISPSKARIHGNTLKVFPRINLFISISGNSEIKYKIEKKSSFTITGIKLDLKKDIEYNFNIIPKFWEKIKKTDTFSNLISKSQFSTVLGITVYEEENLAYYIAILGDETVEGSSKFVIPESNWVILENTGPALESIQKLYKQFYTEWLPTSNYKYKNNFEIEVYPKGNEKSNTYNSELWFSI